MVESGLGLLWLGDDNWQVDAAAASDRGAARTRFRHPHERLIPIRWKSYSNAWVFPGIPNFFKKIKYTSGLYTYTYKIGLVCLFLC